MSREVDPKKQQAIAFAKKVAARLEGARPRGETDRLILVASPEFPGLLRENLSGELRRLIDQEFSLDLAQMSPAEIRGHLPESLFKAPAK